MYCLSLFKACGRYFNELYVVMHMTEELQRLLTCPMITPRNFNDIPRLVRYIDAGGHGADIIAALILTGEDSAFNGSERKRIAEITLRERAKIQDERGSVPQIAIGVTSSSLDRTIELAKHAEGEGADYIVVMPTAYDEDPQAVAESIIKATDNVPVTLYSNRNVGDRLPYHEWEVLARLERVHRLKVSVTDRDDVERYIQLANGKAKVDVGDELLGLLLSDDGVSSTNVVTDGVVAGSANILPVQWAEAVHHHQRQVKMYRTLSGVVDRYNDNPIGAFHYLLESIGVISNRQSHLETNRMYGPDWGELSSLLKNDAMKDMLNANPLYKPSSF